MARPKAKREIATKNIRIYPTTLLALQGHSIDSGKSIARIMHEIVYTYLALPLVPPKKKQRV